MVWAVKKTNWSLAQMQLIAGLAAPEMPMHNIFSAQKCKTKHKLCEPSPEALEKRPQSAPEQQKPLSYNKINSLYYTSGTQPKWIRLFLHVLTKQPFYVCWEWVRKRNLNANQIQHRSAILKLERQEEAVLYLVVLCTLQCIVIVWSFLRLIKRCKLAVC